MIKFVYKKIPVHIQSMLDEACILYNQANVDSNFRQMVKTHFPYTYNSQTLEEIISDTCTKGGTYTIVGFRQSWWSRRFNGTVRAKVYRKDHDKKLFYLNTGIKHRSPEKLHGTCRHEIAHMNKYGHGKNKPHGLNYDNSVPVKLGKLARIWVSEKYDSYKPDIPSDTG